MLKCCIGLWMVMLSFSLTHIYVRFVNVRRLHVRTPISRWTTSSLTSGAYTSTSASLLLRSAGKAKVTFPACFTCYFDAHFPRYSLWFCVWVLCFYRFDDINGLSSIKNMYLYPRRFCPRINESPEGLSTRSLFLVHMQKILIPVVPLLHPGLSLQTSACTVSSELIGFCFCFFLNFCFCAMR